MLLGRDDLNAGKAGRYRRTPLWFAARNGHEGVLKILLRRGTSTPTSLIIREKRHSGVVPEMGTREW